jgi:hypothetical protein
MYNLLYIAYLQCWNFISKSYRRHSVCSRVCQLVRRRIEWLRLENSRRHTDDVTRGWPDQSEPSGGLNALRNEGMKMFKTFPKDLICSKCQLGLTIQIGTTFLYVLLEKIPSCTRGFNNRDHAAPFLFIRA